MVDGLDGLRHDSIVGSHNDDGDIRDLGTTRTHSGEGFVPRGVEESDVLSVLEFDVVSTDVLGDTARLAGDDVGVADMVEERGLTVVHVTHDGDDWAARYEVFVAYLLVGVDFLHHVCCHELGGVAELFCHEVDGLGVKTLVDADHDAEHHACADDLGDRHVHHHGEVVGRYELGEFQHFALCLLLCMRLCHLLAFLLAALALVLAGRGLALLTLQALDGLFYLTLYCLVVHLGLEAFALLRFVLGFLVARIVDVHLVLLDALAFTFLAVLLGTCCSGGAALALLLARLTLTAFLLFGLLLGMRSLVDAAQVNLSDYLGRILQDGLAQCEDFGLLFLGSLCLGLGSGLCLGCFRSLCFLNILWFSLLRFGSLVCCFLTRSLCGTCLCLCLGFGACLILLFGTACGFFCLTCFCLLLCLACSLFLGFLVSVKVYLTHQLRLWYLGGDMLGLLGLDGDGLGYFTFLAQLCLTFCLEFKGHILVKFFSKQQVQVVFDTGVRVRSDFLTLLLTEFHGGGHADVQFFTSLDKFYCHLVNLIFIVFVTPYIYIY